LIFFTAVLTFTFAQYQDLDSKFSNVLGGSQSYDDTAFAISADQGTAPLTPPSQPENYALVILRMIGYLAIVTMVIFAVAWAVRKVGFAGTSKLGGGGSMDIIEVLSFGQNRNAVLIRVADTVYLLGQTPESMVLLEKIEGQKAIDLIASSKGGSSVMNFKEAFNSFIGKMKK
jgi:flagellar biosynthetic protein FliO